MQIGRIKEFDAGGVLFYENEEANSLFIVLDGLVKGGRFEYGKEKVYHFFFLHTMVGEVSFLEGRSYPLTAVFATKGRALIVSKEALEGSAIPKDTLNAAFQKSIIGKVRYLQNSIDKIASKDCRIKTAMFLLEHEVWLAHIQIKEAAAVLNVSRESVSRALSFFIKHQAVSKKGNKITVTNASFLSQFINGFQCDKNHAVPLA